MSWRFRTSFKVMPGLRLNLSRTGLSATVGASPKSSTVRNQRRAVLDRVAAIAESHSLDVIIFL